MASMPSHPRSTPTGSDGGADLTCHTQANTHLMLVIRIQIDIYVVAFYSYCVLYVAYNMM